MKRILLFAVAALLFAAGAQAQIQRKTDSVQRVQSNHGKHQNMMSNLNLTKDQKAKMKEMRSDAKSKREAIQNDQSLTPEQKKQKLAELRKSDKENMNSILTKDQKEKMKQYKKDHPRKERKWKTKKGKQTIPSPSKQSS